VRTDAPVPEAPHRWVVVTGDASHGFVFTGPFETKSDAEDFVFDAYANGSPDAHVAKLWDAADPQYPKT
jgi:hypothetical protein